MNTEYFGKDWSEKPTYAEVVAFSKEGDLNSLIKNKYDFDDSFNWRRVENRINEIIEYKEFRWCHLLSDLYRHYTHLNECPDCIQDWFNHLYNLTLLLEED